MVVARETECAGSAIVVGDEVLEPDIGQVERPVIGRKPFHWSSSETDPHKDVMLTVFNDV